MYRTAEVLHEEIETWEDYLLEVEEREVRIL
jgi:hypothetical protein